MQRYPIPKNHEVHQLFRSKGEYVLDGGVYKDGVFIKWLENF